MNAPTDFRRRSGLVRGRARANLAALRRERLKKKSTARAAVEASVAVEDCARMPGVEAAGTVHGGVFRVSEPSVTEVSDGDPGADVLTPEALGAHDMAWPSPAAGLPDEAAPRASPAAASGQDEAASVGTGRAGPDDAGTPPSGYDGDYAGADACGPDPLPGEMTRDADPAASALSERARALPDDAVRTGRDETSDMPGQAPVASGAREEKPNMDVPFASGDGDRCENGEAIARSDLHDLPGAGSGLVWLLNGAEITTLADLSRADAAGLATQLGRIGELLDLEYWIAIARERTDG